MPIAPNRVTGSRLDHNSIRGPGPRARTPLRPRSGARGSPAKLVDLIHGVADSTSVLKPGNSPARGRNRRFDDTVSLARCHRRTSPQRSGSTKRAAAGTWRQCSRSSIPTPRGGRLHLATLGGNPIRGHDGIRAYMASLQEDWIGFRHEPEEFIDAGEQGRCASPHLRSRPRKRRRRRDARRPRPHLRGRNTLGYVSSGDVRGEAAFRDAGLKK